MPENSPERPDEQLASMIADGLAEAALIVPQDRPKVSERIASGTATQEDWIHWIEQALNVHTVEVSDGEI